MKTFLPHDTMTLHFESGSRHDFPRLARESGFSFNLYRGRVNWAKIGAIDVDKIVRERDLETLQDALSTIMSCSLSSEYDLKVLDPNFIKIFQLAQLAADFLLYCRNYLDHCVIVMQDQLRVALQEIEHLQRVQQQSAEEINSLQKKLKTKSKSVRSSSPVSIFKCSGCEKVFVGERYLLAHQQRRHPELSASDLPSNNKTNEVEGLQQQVCELQDRLRATEDALKQKQHPFVSDLATLQAVLQSEFQKMKPTIANTPNLVVEGVGNVSPLLQTNKPGQESNDIELFVIPPTSSGNSQVEVRQDKTLHMVESTEALKLQHKVSEAALLAQVEQQNNEIRTLGDQLQEQHKAHELVMQRKLEELQRQHQADLNNLRLSITKSRGSGDHIATPFPFSNGSTALERKPHSNYHQENLQAWDNPIGAGESQTTTGTVHETPPSIVSKSKSTIVSSKTPVVTASFSESKQVNTKEESVIQEEYVSPSELDLSVSSSQTSSSLGPTITHESDMRIMPDKSSFEGPSSVKKAENFGSLNHSQSMYDKSSSSASGSSSETGSSSYDSDSQSSNSEQRPTSEEKDTNKSRSQLSSQILEGLKEDLLSLLNRRLRELGVDPEWNGLPVASFNSNIATVKHHQNIAARSQKSYFAIQEELLREVEKRVTDRLKLQQSVPNSSKIQKKRASGSFSIFARLKSHVKSKLSNSSHSIPASSHSQRPLGKSETVALVENVYSQEPSTSKSSPDYEVLDEKTLPMTMTDEASSHFVSKESSTLCGAYEPSNSTNELHENMEKAKPSTPVMSNSVTVYNRSMYASLNRAEMEIEKKELSSEQTSKQRGQLQTSTPIKSGLQSDSQFDVKKPTLIPSDVESISELESDLNDIMENTSEKQVAQEKVRPHTTLTTAELLENVAKFRQNTGQINSSQLIVKSNLKSSVSTGNITKKKVMFRDEKDGFDTIELGPAHSSYESVTPQRSHSESSLAVNYSSPPNNDRPVPQPRNSLTPATTSIASIITANSDSDGDQGWDWDTSNTLTLKKSERESPAGARWPGSGPTKDPGWNTISLTEKPWSSALADASKVSDKVKDIEKKLQKQVERPSFGISTARSPMIPPDMQGRISNTGVSEISSSSLILSSNPSKSLPEDKLLDLLLDDVSSS